MHLKHPANMLNSKIFNFLNHPLPLKKNPTICRFTVIGNIEYPYNLLKPIYFYIVIFS